MRELCATAGVAFESFPRHELLLEQLGKREVDFVILDSFSVQDGHPVSGLPGIVEATRKLRPGLPILYLLPSSPDEDLKGSALAAGVTDFLSRPTDE